MQGALYPKRPNISPRGSIRARFRSNEIRQHQNSVKRSSGSRHYSNKWTMSASKAIAPQFRRAGLEPHSGDPLSAGVERGSGSGASRSFLLQEVLPIRFGSKELQPSP
jgi:hypothetical protein